MADEIRPASGADVPRVHEVIDAAFRPYIERTGVEPQPMTADHRAAVEAGQVYVTGEPVTGVLVLVPEEGRLLLDTVAVHPDARGTGLGRLMLGFAEERARELGLPEIRLFTNELMWENQALYARYGYEVVGRGSEGPYDRIHYRKRV